ncbi:expressed unknown protein [Seminavis robusta]|uniref:Uncharacterized protein n=1 Tax=Seminavis robusta TaxID=568900 RepID=A0A9N8DXR1_9STRA|nr:expressed unknown protein [Seminavis robusta]|eukprot:Sro374_g129280.1 n/a (2048) ;mRNA; f:48497-54932
MTETAKNPRSDSASEDDQKEDKTALQTATSLYHDYCTKATLDKIKIPSAVAMVAIVVTGQTRLFVMHFLYPIYWLILRVIAMALGVALGLGFATHVYDQLDALQRHTSKNGDRDGDSPSSVSRKQETKALLMEHLRGSSTTGFSSGRQFTKQGPSAPSSNKALDHVMFDNGYAALMASAGYDIDPEYKRGRVVSKLKAPQYPFTDVPLDRQYAMQVFSEEWPTLPAPIVKEISRFMEFLMRDYVSTWYSLIDAGVPYPQVVQNEKDRQEAEARGETWEPSPPLQNTPTPHFFAKWMIYSTASNRPLPVMEHIYRSVSICFGNLAHRVGDVNVFRLVLLKWVKVIAHTFKVYRQLRKTLVDKKRQEENGGNNNKSLVDDVRGSVGRAVRRTVKVVKSTTTAASSSMLFDSDDTTMMDTASSNGAASEDFDNNNDESFSEQPSEYQPVSEMAITREFLFTGKLHPAVTFGLEIPSLLFSDPKGQDCGTGVGDNDNNSGEDNNNTTENNNNNNRKDEDQVLEERLFSTDILNECELDYNRVIASRIVKFLIPRQDYGSPIVASLLTEILGGAVLAPTMSCFSPDYLNYWVQLLITMESSSSDTAAEEEESAAALNRASAASNASTPVNAAGQPILRTWGDEDDDEERPNRGPNNLTRGVSEMVLDDICYDNTEGEEMGDLMDLSAKNAVDYSELNKEAAEDLLGTGSDLQQEEESGAGGENEQAPDSAGDDDDDEMEDDDEDIIMEETSNMAGVYSMIALLAEALMNLQRQVDFDECRRNSKGGSGVEVDWDNPSCKKSVLRLVLVVEALVLHGRRKTTLSVVPPGGKPEDATVPNFTQVMMDLTSDIEGFEKSHVLAEENLDAPYDEDVSEGDDGSDVDTNEDYEPTTSDLSTLRTLIAAWLHTGQIHQTVSIFVKAKTTVLRPFYHSRAFLRNPQTSSAFTRQLRALDGVDVMVDTVAILNSPRIDPTEEAQLSQEKEEQEEQTEPPNVIAERTSKSVENGGGAGGTPRKKMGFKKLLDKGMQNLNDKKKAIEEKVVSRKASITGSKKLQRPLSSENLMANSGTAPEGSGAQGTVARHPQSNRELSSSVTSAMTTTTAASDYSQIQQSLPTGGTPRYLDHHRNEAFASSLRSERDRRMQSWITSIQNDTEMIQVVCRQKEQGATPEDIAFHRELHHVARIFYAGTNLIGIRDAARSGAAKRNRLNTADSSLSASSDTQSPEVSLLTVEMACARRRIEVPDDDSSFLLRAQPRQLTSMGVHRDTRNADQSYRGFSASFEEPAVVPGTNRYSGGRYVRRCQLRYYPSNRMASVAFLNDTRKLDQRKGKSLLPENPRGGRQGGSVPFLSPEFLRERHLCQKWVPRGSTSRSQPGIMSSNVMEQADFTAAPRTGRALDFVYRMSLFESPMIDLGGKRFTAHDASSQGAHRADASALEMSDAALSAALLVIGRDYSNQRTDEDSTAGERNKVELGPDGYPIIWMKYSRKLQDGTTSTEIKPYRVSFIRAALLITSTRQEAQLQCLIKCVKAGSAKSATKARTDAQLRPTLRLLDFARDRSREKQEKLLRDLKLGMNHIDREQLRRNALLSPRFPTVIRSIQVSIEKALPAKDANIRIPGNPQSTVFKIRCVAIVDLVTEDIPAEILQPYLTQGGKPAVTYKETWVVYRPFRDFQTLHKHLKTQVAASESSGTAGSRLVGAAAAAFTAGAAPQGNRTRSRNALIPSLGQANKAGALGVTQRSITKRMEILDGYLHYLLSSGHHLSRSPELLMFIGAFYPLSRDVLVGKLPISPLNDPLGRAEMAREALKFAAPSPLASTPSRTDSGRDESGEDDGEVETSASGGNDSLFDINEDASRDAMKSEKLVMTDQTIVNKIDKVPLGQVRSRIFELLSYQFGFENASFFRSQMLSALKTMSFAVTTPGEFRKTLYKAHTSYVSANALAYWLNYGTEMLWPDGVFYISAPALTPEQQKKGAEESRELLHSSFPEQLRTVLGQDLTRDGLDILHEMLQNRLVMKSMFYMLFDLAWEEIFPEMKDILPCGRALDIDFDKEEE